MKLERRNNILNQYDNRECTFPMSEFQLQLLVIKPFFHKSWKERTQEGKRKGERQGGRKTGKFRETESKGEREEDLKLDTCNIDDLFSYTFDLCNLSL